MVAVERAGMEMTREEGKVSDVFSLNEADSGEVLGEGC